MAVVGDEGHASLDQLREFSSAPRLIRTADLLIRSETAHVAIRRHPTQSAVFSRSVSMMTWDAAGCGRMPWLPSGYRGSGRRLAIG